jgi:L-ascorbate metabolism protein UlaG (beta-lactamase superfamily)
MLIKRLQWAGAIIESKGVRLLIDPVYSSPDTSFFGEPKHEFSLIDDIKTADIILLTHLHSDHFDPEFIKRKFGSDILVLVPKGTEQEVEKSGLNNAKGLSIHDEYVQDELLVVASFSIDGLGDKQVSWIIRDSETTLIHCGDTLWHGYWWEMEKLYGPFDACMLPVNGAIVEESGIVNSGLPICMGPEQAVAAAKILKSKLLIPIHYGTFHNPPIYLETENIEERVILASEENKVKLKFAKQDEEIYI